jgi:mRNA export factor
MAAGAAADKKIHVMHLQSGQTLTLEGHTAPVRAVRFVDVPSANAPIIASGSWDKTVRYWDLRQPQPVATLQLPERVYAMDAAGPHLVAVAADHHLHFANLHTNPVQVWKSLKSPLSAQTRCVSLCAGGTRWAVGSIEGRVAAQVVEEKDKR